MEGASIASAVVQRLLNDLYDCQEYLPLLQHVLWRSWENWVHSGATAPIGLSNYEQVGGLASLDQHAEEIYAGLPPPMDEVARSLFQCLTETGPDGHVLRRPTRIADICEIIGVPFSELLAVIVRFREAMLLLTTGMHPDSICDLLHESLMRQWHRLAFWMQEEAQNAKLYQRLEDAAQRYGKGEASLLRGPELDIAQEWMAHRQPREAWARRYGTGFHHVMQFVDLSARKRRRFF